MADLMEEVLVLSRFEAGKMDFRPRAVDLSGFCTRLTEEVLSATDHKCPVGLELGEDPTPAIADERLLHHIFANLLSNAVKYSEAGCAVQFLVERDGRDAVCVVRDRGIGIPKPDRPWLFKAFHRGSNTGVRPGSGLGLLIVKRSVELHGGRIAFTSEVGEGTTFTVRLPVFPDSVDEEANLFPAQRDSSHEEDSGH
jgi:signal transduction histidine kinase